MERIEGLMTEIQENIYKEGSGFPRVDDHEGRYVGGVQAGARRAKGGFILAHWDGTVETEVAIEDATRPRSAAFRWMLRTRRASASSPGKPSHRRVLFARSY